MYPLDKEEPFIHWAVEVNMKGKTITIRDITFEQGQDILRALSFVNEIAFTEGKDHIKNKVLDFINSNS
jgi:hypothetical protein